MYCFQASYKSLEMFNVAIATLARESPFCMESCVCPEPPIPQILLTLVPVEPYEHVHWWLFRQVSW